MQKSPESPSEMLFTIFVYAHSSGTAVLSLKPALLNMVSYSSITDFNTAHARSLIS